MRLIALAALMVFGFLPSDIDQPPLVIGVTLLLPGLSAHRRDHRRPLLLSLRHGALAGPAAAR
jgi:hypothetical protein